MVKIHQVLQNFKYIILEDIYVLKIAKIFLCLSYIFIYFYTNILFLKKKFIKIKKCSSLSDASIFLPVQSNSFKISL